MRANDYNTLKAGREDAVAVRVVAHVPRPYTDFGVMR